MLATYVPVMHNLVTFRLGMQAVLVARNEIAFVAGGMSRRVL